MSRNINYTFEFSTSKKDVESFYKFHSRKSPYHKNKFYVIWLGTPILFFLMILLLDLLGFELDNQWTFKFVLLYSIIWLLVFPLLITIFIKAKIKFNPSQFAIDDLIRFSLDEKELSIKSEQVNIKLNWSEIKYIFSENDIYIYTNTGAFFILPKRIFNNNEEFDEFVEKVEDNIR